MYQALYRKYRPNNFNEVVGQKIVVKTLENAIENNKISHAYIFAGPRGTGKTSIAKIFAKTINCLNLKKNIPCENCTNCINFNNKKNIDVIEIDAASNNGVDEIRNLKNSVNLVPNNSKYKIYIIDEVHMLSSSAFNALLKTLEEPPEFVIFILATTELYKVPETIISRCQNFEFNRVATKEINERLRKISDLENIHISNEAINLISKLSNGGMRDSISLLDQLSSYKNEKIEVEDVFDVCGLISNEQMFELLNTLINNNLKETIIKIEKYNNEGKNLSILFENMLDLIKNILIYYNASDYFEDKDLIKKLEFYSKNLKEEKLYDIIKLINETLLNMKYENNKLLLSELLLIKIDKLLNEKSNILKQKNEPEKIEKKEEKKIEEKKIEENNEEIRNELIEKLKKIRINNTLAQFNKRDFQNFKKEFSIIKNYINDEQNGEYVSLLLDAEIKAKGKEYIIFVYNDNDMSILFNKMLSRIESFLKNIFNEEYKIISTDKNSWEIIKKEFNSNLKLGNNVYKLQEEIIIDNNKKENIIKNNDIDNMFNEIVKYE